MAIKINMLSLADSVSGQGVGSAYIEQTNLVKQIPELEISVNSRAHDFDIYHIHSVNYRYYRRMKKDHVNIVYVHFIPKENEGSIKLPKLATKIFDWYVESFYKRADELVVVNPCFITPLKELGIPEEKITYIPNYVAKETFYPLEKDVVNEIKVRYQIPVDKFIVLGCGQIQTRKGFDDFVKCAASNPDLYFLWVGGFSFGRITHGYKEYKKMMKNLPSNMMVTGIVDRSKMNEIFNIADVLFMPSHKELFPMSILEAANAHKPILLKKLTLYTPILFDKYCHGTSVEEYSEELQKLANDSSYYQKRIDDAIFLSNFYSKERLMEEWKNYYERIYEKYKK